MDRMQADAQNEDQLATDAERALARHNTAQRKINTLTLTADGINALAEWKDAIEQPFDEANLRALKARFDRSVRQGQVRELLYTAMRAEWRAEVEQVAGLKVAELEKKTKVELATLCGYANPQDMAERYNRRHFVESLVSRASSAIASEHKRVMRAWAAMSEAERNGMEGPYRLPAEPGL